MSIAFSRSANSLAQKILGSQKFGIAQRTVTTLAETLAAQVPEKQRKLGELKKNYGSEVVGEVTIDQVIGGARSVKCMLWETSNLDPEEGIRFRGLTIPECQEVLPTYSGIKGDGEPMLESLMWLLLTGDVPTKEQVDTLTVDLHQRSTLPSHVVPLLNNLPKDMHPMVSSIRLFIDFICIRC